MKSFKITAILLVVLILISISCAPGNQRWAEDKPAGFWAGLWHGLILFISFIISLFTDNVQIYEINNTGGWYDFGFLLGAMIILGGSHTTHRYKKSRKKKDWEEIGKKAEEKVRQGIQNWLEDSEKKGREDEWKEIGKKIEEKIKRELNNWADK